MIHVLIERYIADGMLPTYEKLTRTGLQKSYTAQGFISGETFAESNNDHHRFLLTKWRAQCDWDSWYRSNERLKLMNAISPILLAPEKVFILEQ